LIEEAQGDPDEIDDLAPIAMRFNSGLFDLIIGAFATFILVCRFSLFRKDGCRFQAYCFLPASCLL
jgi:hypothetical protein